MKLAYPNFAKFPSLQMFLPVFIIATIINIIIIVYLCNNEFVSTFRPGLSHLIVGPPGLYLPTIHKLKFHGGESYFHSITFKNSPLYFALRQIRSVFSSWR
jgi:hypothetical protein